MDSRLPTHVEISAIRRLAESMGGGGMVLAKGDRDAGSILILTMSRGIEAQYWERMPTLDGNRQWTEIPTQTVEKYPDYGSARHAQDGDLWVIEIDVADAQQFVASLPL